MIEGWFFRITILTGNHSMTFFGPLLDKIKDLFLATGFHQILVGRNLNNTYCFWSHIFSMFYL